MNKWQKIEELEQQIQKLKDEPVIKTRELIKKCERMDEYHTLFVYSEDADMLVQIAYLEGQIDVARKTGYDQEGKLDMELEKLIERLLK